MFAGRPFHMTCAEYEKEHLVNSVVSLGTVSSGSTAEHVGRVATC